LCSAFAGKLGARNALEVVVAQAHAFFGGGSVQPAKRAAALEGETMKTKMQYDRPKPVNGCAQCYEYLIGQLRYRISQV
jgi:hypothetical protein